MTIDLFQALKIGQNQVVLNTLNSKKDLGLEELILKAQALDMRFDESSLEAEKLINNVLGKIRKNQDEALYLKAISIKLSILLKFQNFRIINQELLKWRSLWEKFPQNEKRKFENYNAYYLVVKSYTDHSRSSETGVWDRAIEDINQAIRIFEQSEDYFNLGIGYYFKAMMDWDRGYTQSIEDILEQIMKLQNNLDYFLSNDQYQIFIRSIILFSRGKKENALKKIQPILSNTQDYFPLWVHLVIHFFSGWIYFNLGKVDEVIDIFTELLPLSKKIRCYHMLGWVFRLLGSSYVHLGEISLGKTYIEEAIKINKEIDDPVCLAMTLHEASNLYYYENDIDTAISYLEDLNCLFKDSMHWTQALYLFILLEKGDISSVESFIQKLKANKSDQLEKAPEWERLSKQENFYINLFEILLLKYRKRAKDKIESQIRLEELLSLPLDQWPGIHTYLQATTHYLELLVQEFSEYHEEEVLEEIMKLVTKSIEISKKYRKLNFQVNFSIIEARLLLLKQISIQKQIRPALDLLDVLENQSKIRNIPLLKNQIENEKRNMLEKTSEWKKLSEENISITKIVEDIQLRDYIGRGKKLIDSI
jgi:tetratricopeptide (TPR) repeat protein